VHAHPDPDVDPHLDSAGPPSPPLTNLAQLVAEQARSRPDRVAILQPAQPGRHRRERTWAELDALIDTVAARLAGHGLVAGHRVAICGPNSLDFVVAYFAVLRAGFVAVPLNPDLSGQALQDSVAESGARVLLTAAPDAAATPPPGVAELPLDSDELAADVGGGPHLVLSPQDREALAVLSYTSGTTGSPKLVMLSHRALLAHLENVRPLNIVDANSVVAAHLPMFGIFGLNAVVGGWAMAGATLVVCNGGASEVVDVVEAEGVTNLPVSPALLHGLLHLDRLPERLRTVRTVVAAGAPLSPSLASRFADRTGLRIDRGYGLTEAAPGVSATLGGELHGQGHVGRPLPGVTVRIGDGADDSEPAEIAIKGDNLFSGYWPRGEGAPGPDGWFSTGDLGYLRDGELFLVDHAGDLIEVNGFHVYPAEIEEVIASLPGVTTVAVLGRTQPSGGQDVVAFVVAPGLSEADVVEHCSRWLAKFKRPAEVRMRDELPVNATGKVRKVALRRELEQSVGSTERPA
jgi:long-chain acyl-CoA synthetase